MVVISLSVDHRHEPVTVSTLGSHLHLHRSPLFSSRHGPLATITVILLNILVELEDEVLDRVFTGQISRQIVLLRFFFFFANFLVELKDEVLDAIISTVSPSHQKVFLFLINEMGLVGR